MIRRALVSCLIAAPALADPQRVQSALSWRGEGVSGGTVHLGGACAGYYPSVPQHRLAVGEDDVQLEIDWTDHLRIATRGPDDVLHCGREATTLTGRGIHSIYIGNDEPNVGYDYRAKTVAAAIAAASRPHVEEQVLADGTKRRVYVIPAIEVEDEPEPARAAPVTGGLAGVELAGVTNDTPISRLDTVIADSGGGKYATSIGNDRLYGTVARGVLAVPPCAGTFPARPQTRIGVDKDLPGIVLRLSASTKDARFLVRAPSGAVTCASGNEVRIPAVPAGVYDVFVAGEAGGTYALGGESLAVESARKQREAELAAAAEAEKRGRTKRRRGGLAAAGTKPDEGPSGVIGTWTPLIPVRDLVQPALYGGRGFDEVARTNRARALRAVLRLTVGDRFHCTGTLVDNHGQPAVLTAAHCLYQLDRAGTLGARRTVIRAEELPPLDLAAAILPTSFADCASRGVRYVDCIGEGVADVTLIPFAAPVVTERPTFRLCDAPPTDPELTTFGYGLDRTHHTGKLVAAGFRIERTPPAGPWLASGLADHRILWGDSGGPVISSVDDEELAARAPSACFVTAGVVSGDPADPAASGIRALFQPAWGLSVPKR